MKLTKFFKRATVSLALVTLAMVGLSASRAKAASCIQYDPNSSISQPVFNTFCNVPNGVGNEPDFVRIRQNMNGNNEDNQNNPDYVNALTNACKSGSEFDVHTYIHNGAASGFNNNGSGTSIAKNVMLSMTAPLNKTQDSFVFGSSVSASNAAGVQDNATLDCGSGNNVKLTLVNSSVHIYSQQYNWHNLPNSAVNGTTKIGSPVLGSGNQWGCWEYRIVVVYTVKVEKEQTPPKLTMVCKLSRFEIADRTVKVTIAPEVQNVKVVGYDINWGDHSKHSNKISDSHTYLGNGPFTVTAKFQVELANGQKKWITSDDCTKTVRFATLVSTTPKVLVNTGPGSMLGIFTLTSLAGAFLHRRWTLGRSR